MWDSQVYSPSGKKGRGCPCWSRTIVRRSSSIKTFLRSGTASDTLVSANDALPSSLRPGELALKHRSVTEYCPGGKDCGDVEKLTTAVDSNPDGDTAVVLCSNISPVAVLTSCRCSSRAGTPVASNLKLARIEMAAGPALVIVPRYTGACRSAVNGVGGVWCTVTLLRQQVTTLARQ